MDRKEDYFTRLLLRYQSGACSQEELQELREFLETREGRRFLSVRMEAHFEECLNESEEPDHAISERMRSRLTQAVRADLPANPAEMPIRQRIGWWKWSLAAAAVLLIVWWTLRLFTWQADTVDWQRVVTGPGKQERVLLPDGSVVYVNGDTEICFPDEASWADRRVVWLNGEAFFDVRPDSIKPFFVITDKFSIRVLGTSFNVDTEVEQAVTVHTGRVQVVQVDAQEVSGKLEQLPVMWEQWAQTHEQSVRQPEAPEIHRANAEKVVMLGPQERAGLDKANTLRKEEVPGTDNWMYRDLAFFDQPLGLIVQKLERYYGKQVAVAPELSDCSVTIAASNKTLEETLNALCGLLPDGRVVMTGGRHLIIGKPCQ